MVDTRFSKPKVYDPALADRPLTSEREAKLQQMRDLGFDEPEVVAGGHAEWEEKIRELSEQLEEARSQAQAVQAALDETRCHEARSSQKLQSFQQVNRSQSALVRAELQKTRRKLAHMQAVATKLRDQCEWLKAQSPALSLPAELRRMPTEEDAAEENAELVQLHERWENDLLQIQALLQNGSTPLSPRAVASPEASPSSTTSSPAEMEEARKRISDLETLAKRQKKESDKLKQEIDQLRKGVAASEVSPTRASSQGALSTTSGAADSEAALRKDLEAADEKAKEQTKKLKQLATAYKKLDQEKGDAEARLQEMERALEAAAAHAARPQAPQRKPLPRDVVAKVQASLAASRREVMNLKTAVAADLAKQLPLALEDALRGQATVLQKMVEDGTKEWRDKYSLECDKRRKLHNLVQELKGNIRVYCRVRPLSAAERDRGSCIAFPAPDEIQIRNDAIGMKKTWQFNEVFREDSTQEAVFAGIRDLVVSMLDGYNVCIFAYGQTGAGKTHSMQGSKECPGIYMRTFNELFKVAKERRSWKIELKGALIEVYNEEIRDLLADPSEKRPKLQVRQGKDGNFVPGLTMQPVESPEQVDQLLSTGQQNRTVAATDMNLHSSRSHLLVQIVGSMIQPDGKTMTSAITLVDLAGSERLAKSGVTGDRAKEAIAINKSLTALGDVINSRATKSPHTPFRNSPLTHLLQDSLSGDSKTLMLLQINPYGEHVEESLCSLQFGARVNAVEMKK